MPEPSQNTSNNQTKGLTTEMKQQLAAIDEDDNQDDTASTDNQAPFSSSKQKQSQETKVDVVGNGIQGLIGAINKVLAGSKDLVGAMVSISSYQLLGQSGWSSVAQSQICLAPKTALEDAIQATARRI